MSLDDRTKERHGQCQQCGSSITYRWDWMAWQYFWSHDYPEGKDHPARLLAGSDR